MTVRRFEWDVAKERSNRRKHGIGFGEASQVFDDPFVVSTPDTGEHGEFRWRTFGQIRGLTIVLVIHKTWEEDDTEVVRLISARPATRQERKQYEVENR